MWVKNDTQWMDHVVVPEDLCVHPVHFSSFN